MPEGPECQVVINSIVEKLINKQVLGIEVSHPKIMYPIKHRVRQDVLAFKERMENTWIQNIERRGKYIIFHCSNEKAEIKMVNSLGMTGAWFVVGSHDEIEENYRKHVHIILRLSDGKQLVYSDQRRFGWVGALMHEEYMETERFQSIGPDPIFDDNWSQFYSNMQLKTVAKKPVKDILMKPIVVQGVGNIYASECLHAAKIHPQRKSSELSQEKAKVLYREMQRILRFAVEKGGSSIKNYVDSEGKKGSFQDFHCVYNKEGKPCRNCSTPIVKIEINKRSTFFCPKCQPS